MIYLTFFIVSLLSYLLLAVIFPYMYCNNCGILINSIGVDTNVAITMYDIKKAPLLGRNIQL